MQYALEATKPGGAVVGVDRHGLPQPIPGARFIEGDAFNLPDEEILGGLAAFDVVLSDMAPDTTGVRAMDHARSAALFLEALSRAERLLASGGSFVGKIFQGPDVPDLRRRMGERFSEIRVIKPESSRSASVEFFLCGKHFARL